MASKGNIDAYEKGLEINTKNRDAFGIANYNKLLGDAYVSSWKYETAIEYYKKSLEIYSDIGDLSGRMKSNLKLGTTYFKLWQFGQCLSRLIGDYEKAIKHFDKGLAISTAIGDRSGIAAKNCNLGSAYHSLEDYEKAINQGLKSYF